MFVNSARLSNLPLQDLTTIQGERKPDRIPLRSPGDGMDPAGNVKYAGPLLVFVGGLIASHYLDELMFNSDKRPPPRPNEGGQGASGNSGTGQGGASGQSGAGGAPGMATNAGGTQGTSGAGGSGGSSR